MALSKKPKPKKVLVALSGGVDSAVSAALLLRQGYEVEAAFMKNWSSTTGLINNECPWIDDRRNALQVAAHLGIPMHTFDFEEQYKDKVMQYFFDEYAAGRTPNPDVMCNKEIKFKLLYDKAMHMGFDFLATGHYARIGKGKLRASSATGAKGKTGLRLMRAKDQFKDQTYFIYNIQTEQLEHLLFPIGDYLKTEVRALAKKFMLPNANRKESMGLCFVGKIRLETFLQQAIPAKPGNIVDINGAKIGVHRGIAHYTIGQRQGLGLANSSGPYYVIRKDLPTNTLVVSAEHQAEQLLTSEIEVSGINWLAHVPKFPLPCKARFRHQQELQQVTIKAGRQAGTAGSAPNSLITVEFKTPQRAVASGQSLVLYIGAGADTCLGGGIIV